MKTCARPNICVCVQECIRLQQLSLTQWIIYPPQLRLLLTSRNLLSIKLYEELWENFSKYFKTDINYLVVHVSLVKTLQLVSNSRWYFSARNIRLFYFPCDFWIQPDFETQWCLLKYWFLTSQSQKMMIFQLNISIHRCKHCDTCKWDEKLIPMFQMCDVSCETCFPTVLMGS